MSLWHCVNLRKKNSKMWLSIFLIFISCFFTTCGGFYWLDCNHINRRVFVPTHLPYQEYLPLVMWNVFGWLPLVLYFACPLVSFDDDCLWWHIPLDLLVFVVLFDVFFTATHSILHRPYFYNQIHFIHHRMTTNCIAVGAFYCHPLEFVFGNVLPAMLAVLCHWHIRTMSVWIWSGFAAVNVAYAHGGYEFLPRVPSHLWHHKLQQSKRYLGTLGLLE